MSTISRFDFLLQSNNRKSIILTLDDNDITVLDEIHIQKPVDINTIQSIRCTMGGSYITNIPIKLLIYMGYTTDDDDFYKIKIPKELFFRDKNFVGYPMIGLKYHEVEYNLECSDKQNFKILCEKKSLPNDEKRRIMNTTFDYTTSDYIMEEVYGMKKIALRYEIFCTGFFIASRKLPSMITVTLDGNIFFEYDEWMYKYCGIHLCGNNNWTQSRFDEVYPLVADSGINHHVMYNIIEMTRPDDGDMAVYWIPFKPHQKWDDNTADSGIDFARIDSAFITFPEEFTGTLYIMYQNKLRVMNNMCGLRYAW